MGQFNPHDHLVKQGWQGKGTGESISIECLANHSVETWSCDSTYPSSTEEEYEWDRQGSR